MTNNVLFKENSATTGTGAVSHGGAIYLNSSANYEIKFTNFISNSTNGYGGAIYVANGSLNLNKINDISTTSESNEKNLFEGNTAKMGGALFAEGTSNVTIITATFRTNYATENGGACYFALGSSGNAILKTSTKLEANGKATASRTANGGAIYVASGKVEMEDACLLTNNEATNGGGVFVATGGTLTIKSSTLSSNNATIGGAIATYGTLELKGNVLTGNTAESSGGALAVLDGTTKVNESKTTFTGNASNGLGGAIYVAGGTVELVGTEIIQNTALQKAGGGAIYTFGGTTTLMGTEITKNTLQDGSTIGAGLSVAGGVLNIADGETSDISNTISNGENATIAISDTTQSKPAESELDVKTGLVLSGDIDGISDGIYILTNKSFVSIKTDTEEAKTKLFRSTKNVSQNLTKKEMKRINVYLEAGKFSVNDKILQFMPNDQIDTGLNYIEYFNLDIASGFGLKAIIDKTNGDHAVLRAQNFQVYGKKSADNILYAESETLSGALKDLVTMEDGYSKYLILVKDGEYEITDQIEFKVQNLVLSAKGNATFVQTYRLGFGNVTQTTTFGYDSDFDKVYNANGGCGKLNIVVNTDSQFEGSVFNVKGATLILSKNLVVTGKSSTQNGSIVTATDNSEIIISGAELNMEEASASSIKSGIYGGVVYIENSSFTMTDGKISNGVAEFGGAVYAKGSKSDSTVKNENVKPNWSTVTISGGTISNNHATSGGGLYADILCKVNITGGNISSNTAVNGGGVYVNGKEVDVSSEIETYSPTYLTMSGGEVLNNTASENGGGIFLNGLKYVVNKSSDEEEDIKLNTLFTIELNIVRVATTFSGGEISSNKATNGGGIYFCDSIGRFEGQEESYLKMFKNSANLETGKGGAVYVDYVSSIKASQIEVRMLQLGDEKDSTQSNKAKYGEGIYLSEQARATAMAFSAEDSDDYLSGNIKISDAIYLQLAAEALAKIRIDRAYDYNNQKIKITSPILATQHGVVVGSYSNSRVNVSKTGDILEDIFEGTDSDNNQYCFILDGYDIIIAERNFYVYKEGPDNPDKAGRFYESMSTAIVSARGKAEGNDYVVLILKDNVSTNANVGLSGNKVTIMSADFTMNGNKYEFTYDVTRTINLDISQSWLTLTSGELVLKNINIVGNAKSVVEVQSGTATLESVTIGSADSNNKNNIAVATLTGGRLTATGLTVQNIETSNNIFDVKNANLTVENSTIKSVQAVNIVSATSKATVVVSNTTISDASGDTETIFNLDSVDEDNKTTATLTNVTISNNTVKGSTIKAVGKNTLLNINGSAITNNKANENGGALFVDGAQVNFEGTTQNNTVTLTGNVATNGGAIYLASGELKVPSIVVLSGNRATNGGGIYVAGETLTLETDVLSNSADITNGAGGGLYISAGEVMFKDVQIAQNKAYKGGGVYLTQSGRIVFDGKVTIEQNTGKETVLTGESYVSGYGGGLYIENSTEYNSEEKALILDEKVTISSNKSANGGGIYIKNAYVTINGASISGNYATKGGGICVSESAKLTLLDGVISGNEKIKIFVWTSNFYGGGVYVDSGSFVMSGGVISNNESQFGGGVCVINNGTFTMTGGSISNNSAVKGGGVLVSASASFTMNGESAIIGGLYNFRYKENSNDSLWTADSNGNNAVDGGGVYAELSFDSDVCNVQLISGTISFNEAENGGGVYLVGVNADSANDLTFSTNVTNNIAQNGGALYVGKNTVKLSDVQISNNDASENGGGIYVNKDATLEIANGIVGQEGMLNGKLNEIAQAGSLDITSSKKGISYKAYGEKDGETTYFYINAKRGSGNSAGVAGGGVYVATGGTLNLNGGVVIYNFAPIGGGIANYGTVNLQGSTGTDTAEYLVNIDGTLTVNPDHSSFAKAILFRNNTAGNNGGAIYTEGAITINGGESNIVKNETTKMLTGKGIVFISNMANNAGGAIYVANGLTKIYAGMFGNRFDDKNVASNYTNNVGGAIAVGGGELVIGSDTGTSKINFNENYSVNGGALAVTGGTVDIKNSENVSFLQNEARGGNGGAIYVANGNAEIKATFSNNKATNGGAIATAGGETTFSAGTMVKHEYQSNGSTIEKGGAVFVGGGSFKMSGGLIGVTSEVTATKESYSNKANLGGGVYVENGGTFTMQGQAESSISYNHATESGGGVYVNGGTFNLIGGTIRHNSAITNGGGLYMNGGTANDKVGSETQTYSIYGNTATNGGGIYLDGSVTWNFTATEQSYAIENNTATNGGGMFIANGETSITVNSFFKNNTTSNGKGGGIFADRKIKFTGKIYGSKDDRGVLINIAEKGGGIYLCNNARGSNIGGELNEIQATNGGAVYTELRITFSGNASSNKAENGGALYLSAGGTVSGNVEKNISTKEGGGVYSKGNLIIQGSVFGNTAEGNGGGVYVTGDLELNGGSITRNTTKIWGGGAYIDGDSRSLTLSRRLFAQSTIANNSSERKVIYQADSGKTDISCAFSYVDYSESYPNGVFMNGSDAKIDIGLTNTLCADSTGNTSNNFALIVEGSVSLLKVYGTIYGSTWLGNYSLDTNLVVNGRINGNVNVYPQGYLKYYNKMACRATVHQYRIRWRSKYIWILWVADIVEWKTTQWCNESFTHETNIKCNGATEQKDSYIGFFNCKQESAQEWSDGIRGWFDYMFEYYYANDSTPVATMENWKSGKVLENASWSYPSNDYSRKYTNDDGYTEKGEIASWTRDFSSSIPAKGTWRS